LLVNNQGRTYFPHLKTLMKRVDRDSWEARFASLFRSRCRPLEPALAEELIRVYETERRSAPGHHIARTYDEAMPYPPPKLDTHRRATYRRLRAKVARKGSVRCCCRRIPTRRRELD